MDMNKEILKAIRYTRDRMHSSLIMDITMKALFIALGIFVLLAVAARFFPIYDPYGKGVIIIIIISVIGFLASLFMPPKNISAALLLDSKGLSERIVTAYELIDCDSEIALLQKKDAAEKIKGLNIKKEIKVSFPKRVFILCLLLSSIILLSSFIPNPMKEKAIALKDTKNKIESQEKEIEKIIKKVEENNKISMEHKEEALEKLKELKKEINKAKDSKEALKAIQRTENKIEMMKDKYDDKDMDKIIEAFARNQETKSLADALKSGDTDRLKEDILEAAKALQNLNSDDIKELSDSLKDLSKALEGNPELATAISKLGDKIAGGELGDMQSELDALGLELENLMENEEFKMAMGEVINQLNNQGSQGQGVGQGQAAGQGQGQGQAAGQGQGQGAGAGSGSGGDKDGISESGSSGLGKKGTTGGELKEYESVFATRLLGGEGELDPLKGTKGEEGDIKVFKMENGLTVKGEMLPYNQVIGEYKEQAFQSMENNQVPQGMQNIVKEYFTSLGD